jgi:hypothetical protein
LSWPFLQEYVSVVLKVLWKGFYWMKALVDSCNTLIKKKCQTSGKEALFQLNKLEMNAVKFYAQ